MKAAVKRKKPAGRYNQQYLDSLLAALETASMDQAIQWYERLEEGGADSAMGDDWMFAELGRADVFFLLLKVLRRADIAHPWLYARCREVEHDPDGHLDLWAREHYKSTIITFALTIQDILREPEITVGIFSHSRPLAKNFMRQIKTEFETNENLKALYPTVLWQDPKKDSPKWSEDEGLVVRRKGNPKEATIEAWGLVDGQPTGKHFKLIVWDDVVVRESVNTPDMIKKTTEMLELSYSLGVDGGARRFIGTRYHVNDSYRTVTERGTAKPRIYPATVDGTVTGVPVLLTRETLAEKRRDMGPYTFGCQMLQNPTADSTQGFKREWLKHYKTMDGGKGMNRYITVDPASSRKENADYTCMFVLGLGADMNIYVLDMIRDRLSLTERADALMKLHRRWKPLEVRYEQYGLQADIEHIRDRQERENHRFRIHEVGGSTRKEDRIRRLVPLFEGGRIWFPATMYVPNLEGRSEDLVKIFIEDEYGSFPVSIHDDMLDALSRIAEPDLTLKWPKPKSERDLAMRSVEPWVPFDPDMGM